MAAKKKKTARAPRFPVKIKIQSEQKEFYDYFFMPPEGKMLAAPPDDEGNSNFDFSTIGYLSDGTDSIDISYLETEMTGLNGSYTKISVSKKDNGIVTMSRVGEYNTFLVFQKGKRHICAFEGAPYPYQMCIQTNAMKNRITGGGGQLMLDYVLEINGATAERSSLTMTVELDVTERC